MNCLPAPLVEQVLSKQVLSKQVLSLIFSKNLAVIITLEWTTKAFTAKVSIIYILKSKTKQMTRDVATETYW